MRFDPATLLELNAREEVEIETARPDGRLRRTVIWVVVDGDDVFVRSVRGDRGYWYQAAIEPAARVALLIDGRRIPVRAIPATDGLSIEACSRGFERKYAADVSLHSMLRPAVLGTTLRLEPLDQLPAR